MAPTDNPRAVSATRGGDRSGINLDLLLLVVMLVLALVGVGVTQMEHAGGKLYWLFLVLVYAAISVARAWQGAKAHGRSIWPMIRAQVLHWLGTLVAINIVLWFESADVAPRGAASDYTLLVLALSCYLAGVHFNLSYLLLGAVLAVAAVGLGYLDQLSLYAVIVPLAVVAVWIYAKGRIASAPGS